MFRADDFDEVNARYFDHLRAGGVVAADPSGWTDTVSSAAEHLPKVEIRFGDLGRYYLDEGTVLGSAKRAIVELIGVWEQRAIAPSEVTLTHSVSAATLRALVVLKRRGVRTIFFETPGYAVTMNQAEQLGFAVRMVPTYRHDDFAFAVSTRELRAHAPCAVWLTQPRMSLGVNQSAVAVAAILRVLGPRDFLVVDEATERQVPSVLATMPPHPRLLRMRGLFKGLGLNGLRLAFLLHAAELRAEVEAAQEVCGDSLDLFSLALAEAIACDINVFRAMTHAVDRQIGAVRAMVRRLSVGSGLSSSDLVNGYIGSLFVPFSAAYDAERMRLLQFCSEHLMPVILSASMRYALDPTYEVVRVNYFNRPKHIELAVQILSGFLSCTPEDIAAHRVDQRLP